MDSHKILVVDDEPDLEGLVNQRMRRDIRSGRYSFVYARNGVEALELLGEDDGIDIVITDINMPEMDGLTLLEQIPAFDPKLRCVIVSAYGDMKNIRTAMNRGAFDFLNKPIDFEDLRQTIEKSVEHLAVMREAFEARDKMLAEGRP
ncbi:MAG: response regulator [Nitrospinae bacterium]|nr:response regulator [Nitrospinota bacterium]